MLNQTTEPQEIFSVLKGVLRLEDAFTMWQRDSNHDLLVEVSATIISMELKENKAIFKLSEQAQIDSNFPLYFAVKNRQIVFKLESVSVKEGIIECTLPESLKYRERRKHKRTKIRRNVIKEMELIFSVKDVGNQEKIISRLVDFSEGGACFVFSKETLKRIDLTKLIMIRSLASDIDLNADKALVVNTRRFKGMTIGHEELYSVGIMFVYS